MTACGEPPRLALAGLFVVAGLLFGIPPTAAQVTDTASQQKTANEVKKGAATKGGGGEVKPPAKGDTVIKPKAEKSKKPRTKPKAKSKLKPRPKPKPKPKPKPAPEALPAPTPEPVWRSMPAPEPLPLPKPKIALTAAQAAEKHTEGLAAERVGDDHGALRAFLEAAEAGHGPAQLKLAEIYDRGNAAVERDYATALGWYQKARESGMPVPKPHVFPAGR